MNENGREESSLDQAIDVVAREMTALDAPAGMRAEILARIESAPQLGSALLPRWAMAASIAVIVLAVTAVIWFARPAGRPDTVTATHNSSPVQTPGAAKPEPQPSEKLAATELAMGIPADTQSGRGALPEPRAAAVAEPEQDAAAVPDLGPAALAQPVPIAIAALGPDAIHIPDIGIEPIGDLKPITIQDIPVGSTEIQRRQNR